MKNVWQVWKVTKKTAVPSKYPKFYTKSQLLQEWGRITLQQKKISTARFILWIIRVTTGTLSRASLQSPCNCFSKVPANSFAKQGDRFWTFILAFILRKGPQNGTGSQGQVFDIFSHNSLHYQKAFKDLP
ncbi:unnamed protein product [Lepidochelys kempii]